VSEQASAVARYLDFLATPPDRVTVLLHTSDPWVPFPVDEEPKREPGEVTSLLDPFNLTDEALRYRRECGGGIYGAVWTRLMVEVIEDHDCGAWCWAEEDADREPSASWSGYIEWEEAA
jgi:hypothetical protein